MSQQDQLEVFEKKAKDKVESPEYSEEQQRKHLRKRQINDSNAKDVALQGSQKFKVETYLPIIDKICSALSHRIESYENVHSLCGFLVEFPTMNDEDISTAAAKFQKMYLCDIELQLMPEFLLFSNFIGQFDEFRNKHETVQASDIYTLVVKNGLTSLLPDVEIALWIYLCLMISKERSFSKLKLIKNAHRSTMGQDRLNRLSLMSIEKDVLNNIQFTDILEKFVSKKLLKANI